MHYSSHSKQQRLLPEDRIRVGRGFLRATAILAALALGSGCVGLGTYSEVSAERDQLAERVRLLEASTESLSNERVELLEGLEDLREEHVVLSRGVESLTVEREELSKSLSAREAELERQNTEVARLRGTYDSLVTDLESELAAGQIQIQQLKEGLQVNVSSKILFDSGSASLSKAGREVIAKVAARLAKLTHGVDVDGHTDDVPIRGVLARRYPTNWELAGARAASVVRLLSENGVANERLVAISHGATVPVASNEEPEGRALNRRIEIRLRPLDDVIEETALAPEAAAPPQDAEPAGDAVASELADTPAIGDVSAE